MAESREDQRRIEEEIQDLQLEIEQFKKEKERVRAIVGSIGGVPHIHTHLINTIFVVLILSCLVVSLLSHHPIVRLAVVELAVALISVKVIVIMRHQTRVNHFQLWILTSLEWQINEVMKRVRALSAAPSEPNEGTEPSPVNH